MMNKTIENLINDLINVDADDAESVAEFRAKYSEIDTYDLQGYIYEQTGCSLYVASSPIGDIFDLCDVVNFSEDCAEKGLTADHVIGAADHVAGGVFDHGATLVDWSKFPEAA